MSWQSKLKKSNFDVAPLPGAMPLFPISINNFNSSNNFTYDPSYPIPIIAKDPIFMNRLDTAMLKSFKYIDRKDDIAAGLFAPEDPNEIKLNSLKNKKFANLFRKKVNTGMCCVQYY